MKNKNKIYSIFSELVLEAESREEARDLADHILAWHGLYYRITKCIEGGSKGIRDFLKLIGVKK